MVALVSLLTIIVLSITVVRIGAAALERTGLSRDVAAFQAQSAFSGAGFTTQESETIVTHPLRRRIVRLLILLGSVGISSSFLGAPRGDTVLREGDLLICYAREQVSKNLASRIKGTEGNKEHAEKVAEERRLDEHRRHTDDYG